VPCRQVGARGSAIRLTPPLGWRLKGHTMAGWLIALTGVVYAYVAADLAWHGKSGLAIAYAGYAFANVGLYMAATR
jgi:hypothetical protein